MKNTQDPSFSKQSSGNYIAAKVAGTFLLHQVIATIGTIGVTTIVTSIVLPTIRARALLTGSPYFPLQVVSAFIAGFVLQRFLRHRMMFWMWVVPLVVLLISFFQGSTTFAVKISRYFGYGCLPEQGCFVQLGITLPLYVAASYSFAAILSRKVFEARKHR